jgi:hypothetical protein
MRATKRQTEAVRAYVEDQAHEQVIHLEKVASELVGPVRHDIWDVHCPDSRWWVITEPTNLYSQEDFKSRDGALTFHVGLAMAFKLIESAQARWRASTHPTSSRSSAPGPALSAVSWSSATISKAGPHDCDRGTAGLHPLASQQRHAGWLAALTPAGGPGLL